MKSTFLLSSPNSGPLGSSKRGFSDELQESPSVKRAKRAKHGRKRRAKEVKDGKNPERCWEQKDWLSADGPWADSLIAQKQKQIPKPAASLPDKEDHTAYVKSEEDPEKHQKQGTKDTGAKGIEGPRNGTHLPTADDGPNAATITNTCKTRPERKLHNEPKYPIDDGIHKIPATAGPSESRIIHSPAYESRELTPLSDLPSIPDYTFKAYPNPVPAHLPPAIQTSEEPRRRKRTDPAADSPNKNSIRASAPSPELPKPSDEERTQTSPPVQLAVEAAAPLKTTKPTTETDGLAAPAGTKTLRAINKRLKALEASLVAAAPSSLSSSSSSASGGSDKDKDKDKDRRLEAMAVALRADVARLHERLDRDEARAAIRHEILFNALLKVAGDVGALGGEVVWLLAQDQRDQRERLVDGNGGGAGAGDGRGGDVGVGNGTPRAATAGSAREVKDRLSRSMQQSRKTLEQCLRIYTEDMNRAERKEEVAKYGGLVVQYAGDLFKTLG
ncbi:hypothetical protein C7999DRAFT_14426 [Corynascus novoguineensis]|uniref:Uncharacterized protein n=1 Tax=Corynascus novoguineensis TaxID=1126955 RepID=A0AAN7CUM7_9PEZI|nr:hypothetical protein C7999DRAFT_14426 [Corynascus novoguineensis]